MNKISQNQHLFISKTNKISKIIFTTAAFHKERSDKRKDKTSTAFFGRQSPPLPKTHLRFAVVVILVISRERRENPSTQINQKEYQSRLWLPQDTVNPPASTMAPHSWLRSCSPLSLSSSAMCPSPTRAISKLMQPWWPGSTLTSLLDFLFQFAFAFYRLWIFSGRSGFTLPYQESSEHLLGHTFAFAGKCTCTGTFLSLNLNFTGNRQHKHMTIYYCCN